MHLDAVQTRGYYLNIAAMRQLFYYWENPLPHRHAFSLETRRQNLLLVIGLGFLLRKNKEAKSSPRHRTRIFASQKQGGLVRWKRRISTGQVSVLVILRLIRDL